MKSCSASRRMAKGVAVITAGGNIEHIQLNSTDPWTEVDGERSSVKAKHPVLSDPAVRQALDMLVDRQSVQDQIYGRTGVAIDPSFVLLTEAPIRGDVAKFSISYPLAGVRKAVAACAAHLRRHARCETLWARMPTFCAACASL